MIDANSIAIGAVSGVGIFVVGKIILKGLGINSKPKNNPHGGFTKEIHDELCDSRLETIKTIIVGLETNIHTKLDNITERLRELKRD